VDERGRGDGTCAVDRPSWEVPTLYNSYFISQLSFVTSSHYSAVRVDGWLSGLR